MNDPLLSLFLLVCVSATIFGLLYFGDCLWWWLRRGLGAGVPLRGLCRARVRGVPPRILVDGARLAREGGLRMTGRELETLYLSGGDVIRSVTALLAAKKAGLDFSFKKASALALEGRDPLAHVQDLLQLRNERMHGDAEQTSPEAVAGLMGSVGEVEFAVAPPGVVRVSGMRVAAMSDGGYIDKGKHVRIIAVRGNVAVVEQAEHQ